MIRKVIRISLTIMGIMLGYFLANSILSIKGISQIDNIRENLVLAMSSCIIFSLIIGIIFYFISVRFFTKRTSKSDEKFS